MEISFSDELLESIVQLARGSGVIFFCVAAFWGADKLLSSDGRAALWKSMETHFVDRNASILIFDKYFGYDTSAIVFAKRIAILSCAALAITLSGFSYLVPEFTQLFIHNPDARAFIIRGVITEGFLSVFFTNAVATLIAMKIRRSLLFQNSRLAFLLIVDIVARLFIFGALVALVYFISAGLFGSFSGDQLLALKAVLPTLRGAVIFENITGAYLYAAAIAGLPLFVSAVIEQMQERPNLAKLIRAIFFFLPFHKHPIRSTSFVVGTFFAVFSVVARFAFGVPLS